MVSKKVEEILNKQAKIEVESSQYYLAMASWAETQGFNGTANFMYDHADEERMHYLKLVKYINERGGHAIISAVSAPPANFKSIIEIYEGLLAHEIMVTNSINSIVDLCLQEKDYPTYNFMQWYVSEQIEEEALARTVLDKLKLIGNDKGGMYLFDRDIETMTVQSAAAANPA